MVFSFYLCLSFSRLEGCVVSDKVILEARHLWMLVMVTKNVAQQILDGKHCLFVGPNFLINKKVACVNIWTCQSYFAQFGQFLSLLRASRWKKSWTKNKIKKFFFYKSLIFGSSNDHYFIRKNFYVVKNWAVTVSWNHFC